MQPDFGGLIGYSLASLLFDVWENVSLYTKNTQTPMANTATTATP